MTNSSPNRVDRFQGRGYTEGELDRLIEEKLNERLSHLHSESEVNLGNRIEQDDAWCMTQNSYEGELNMPSKIKKTYNYTTPSGEKATIRFAGATEREADQRFQDFLLSLYSVTPKLEPKASALTIRSFITDVYLPSYTRDLRPTTLQNYKLYIDNYIIPFIGKLTMEGITVDDVQVFMDKMAKGTKYGLRADLNKKTIDRVCGLCGRIFRIAMALGKAKNNPFKSVLLFNTGKEASHHKPLPDAEIARIKSAIPTLEKADERLFMGLLAYTGMRREEIFGLRWEDLNLRERYGTVVRAVTYPGKSKPHIGLPKSNASARVILIAESLKQILISEWKPSGYVLGGDAPMCYSSVQRLVRRAFRNLHIVSYSMHDFRTTFGTQMKESGLTSAQVADLLGHADTRMVETVYARTRQEGVMKNLSVIDRLNNAPCPLPVPSGTL